MACAHSARAPSVRQCGHTRRIVQTKPGVLPDQPAPLGDLIPTPGLPMARRQRATHQCCSEQFGITENIVIHKSTKRHVRNIDLSHKTRLSKPVVVVAIQMAAMYGLFTNRYKISFLRIALMQGVHKARAIAFFVMSRALWKPFSIYIIGIPFFEGDNQ
jgi:hypothetical protein